MHINSDENKIFDGWNSVKKSVHHDKKLRSFKQRDIFYIKMGQNIGYEQNGKGDEFVRPVVIFKKFNHDMFFGMPLSTKIKEGRFYYVFEFNKNGIVMKNIVLLSQLRLFSANRLLNKIGVMEKNDFKYMKDKFKNLLD